MTLNPATLRNEAALMMAKARKCAEAINAHPLSVPEVCEFMLFMIFYEDAAERRLAKANEIEAANRKGEQ